MRVAFVALLVASVFAILATIDAGGAASLWANAHWTLFDLIAVGFALAGWRSTSGEERRVRLGIAAAACCWLAGQVAWDIQVVAGLAVVPAPSDILFLSTIVPAVWVLDRAVRPFLAGRARLGIYLDAGVVLLATAAVMTLAFGHLVATGDVLSTIVLLSLPVAFLSVAGAGLVVAVATDSGTRPVGIYALLLGFGLLGAGYLSWVADAPSVPAPASLSNLLFSAGVLSIGIAGATFRISERPGGFVENARTRVLDALPVAAVAVALACLIATTVGSGSASLVRPLGWSVIAVAVLRQVLMARERATALRQAHDAALEMARAEARHRRVIEQIPATLYIDERTTPDQHPSQLVFVSPQVRRLLGYDGEELRASPDRWYALIHPDDAARVGAAEDDHFRTGERLDQEFRMRVSDGRYVWIRDEASLLVLPDGRLQSHGVLTDVTSEKDAEAQLRASEEQQRRIIETASSAYVSIDDQGVVIEWNERATQTFGWSRDEALGRSLAELIVPEASRAAHQAGIRRYLATGSGPLVGERTEVQAVDKSGRHLPVELTIWPVRVGDGTTFSALIHDITERRRLEDELRHQAFHDSLTGLANRALFSDRLGHALERRDRGTIAVVSFDLDDFKLVNDGLGHPAGDELLVQVATRLGRLLRAADTAARFGGDEFAVLIEDTDEDAAARVAERIIGAFSEPFRIHGRGVVAQASVGLTLSVPGVSAEAMLRDADAAMYEAKRRGKGIWLRFDPVLSRSGIDALELRADLKTAIERHQLTLAYQPIVDLETREIMGVEALARWTHPTRGVIPPSTFIQIAEASDLITSLGTQVLRDACAAVQGWRLAPQGKPDLSLSVNLSARQLLHPTIVEDVRSVLFETGLDARALTLEITEGVVVDDAGSSLAAIEGLKALGVRIAIDDFGTGYSSLSYLSRLPIDVLKIDRSFIAELEASRPAAALVRSIIRIGQTLHLDIVAEGVETDGQCDRLHRLGARFGQGYLFSVPLDRAGMERSLGLARPRTAGRTARRSSALAPGRRCRSDGQVAGRARRGRP